MTQPGRLFLVLAVLLAACLTIPPATAASTSTNEKKTHSLVDSLEEVGHTLHDDSIRLGEGMINGVKSAISKPSALDRFILAMKARLPHQPAAPAAEPVVTHPTNTTMNATTTTNTTVTHTPTTSHTPSHPAVIHPRPHPHPHPVVIGSHEAHGHGQSHLKGKKHHPKGYPGESPTVLQPSDRTACCYGCLWKGFGCEKKCRICCPEGQAAVCDNTPNCTCSSAAWTHGLGKAPIPHGHVIQHKHDDHLQQAYDHADSIVLMQRLKEVLKLLEHKVHAEEKSSPAAKPVHPFHTMVSPHQTLGALAEGDMVSPVQHLNEITTSGLSMTDIIIIVVVVVVVLFCCGGFGYSRYRSVKKEDEIQRSQEVW